MGALRRVAAVRFGAKVERSKQFIPLDRLPIVSPTESLSDTLQLMQERGTRAVLVQHGPSKFRLLTVPGPIHVGSPAGKRGGRSSIVAQDPTSPVGQMGVAVVAAGSGIRTAAPGRGVRGVFRGDRLAGLFFGSAALAQSLLEPPVIYACAAKPRHYYHPPPPAACLVDGTAVKPA